MKDLFEPNRHGKKPVDRFWKYVEKTPGCWFWTGAFRDNGYGQLGVHGRVYKAHRTAYFLKHGIEPKGIVRHTCDDKRCVNPDHLVNGTQKDNCDDMVRRGRSTKGRPFNGGQRLTKVQVNEIRQLCSKGVTQREVAKRFGVTEKHVGRIVRFECWKD